MRSKDALYQLPQSRMTFTTESDDDDRSQTLIEKGFDRRPLEKMGSRSPFHGAFP